MTTAKQKENGTERVLLVDDNPTNLQVLYQTLDGRGYRLLVANNGEQALSIAKKTMPVLILLDIMMPGIDGFDTCRKLKEDPDTAGSAVIFLSALDDVGNKVRGFGTGAVDYISKPFDPDEVIARVETHLKIRRLENDLSLKNEELKQLNEHLELKVRERSAQLLRGRDAVIIGMARLAETRDNETGQHLERMCRYSEMLAQELAATIPELDDDWIRTIRMTAALHDIGKIGIPDAVLHKPGRLDSEERRVMDRHPAIGGETLMEIQEQWGGESFLEMASQIAMHHHEKWDGSGYPAGLAGTAIPLAARIVALADVYDALTSNRPYKKAWTHEAAMTFINEGSESHFDPAVVSAFNALSDEFRQVASAFHNQEAEDS